MSENYSKKGYLLEDFKLFHINDHGTAEIDYHYHEFYKLLFLVSGSGAYFIEGKRYSLKSGDIVLIGCQYVHRPEFDVGNRCERIILYISPEFLTNESTGSCDLTECFSKTYDHVLRPDEKMRKKLFSLAGAIEKELSDGHYGSEISSSGILLRLLIEIARGIRQENVHMPAPILPKSQRMLDVIHYLDEHLTEELDIEFLSQKFYLSRFHLMRRFKEETGTTIHNYLSAHRLMMARDLIAQGHAATEVCFQCGFGSYSSFSRAYRKFFGTTPTGKTDFQENDLM